MTGATLSAFNCFLMLGGLISFELRGGIEMGVAFMNHLRLITRAVSLGDAETVI